MQASFLSTIVILILVIDPLGIIPLYVALMQNVPKARRARVIMREISIAFAVLLLFMLFGRGVMEVMQLSDASLAIAGGIILFLIALRMIFPHPDGMFGKHSGEPFVVPLAIPLLAGPSSLATVLLLASREPDFIWLWVGVLTVVMGTCAIILLLADRLTSLLGPQVLIAIERLMGLILTALAVKMLLEGIKEFIHQL